MNNDELERIKHFLKRTEDRIIELEGKKDMTRAEIYELDACKYDVTRAKRAINEEQSKT